MFWAVFQVQDPSNTYGDLQELNQAKMIIFMFSKVLYLSDLGQKYGWSSAPIDLSTAPLVN